MKLQRHKRMKKFCVVVQLFTGRARSRARNGSSVAVKFFIAAQQSVAPGFLEHWTFLNCVFFPNQQCSLLF